MNLHLLLPLALLAASTISPSNGAEVLLALQPTSPPLPQAGVPQLHETVEQALHPEDGLAFAPQAPFQWAYLEGQANPLSFATFVNPDHFDHAILTIWNWRNRAVAQTQLASGQEVPVSIDTNGLGTYQVTVDGYKDGQCLKRLVRSFAVTQDLNTARKTWKKEEFFLGVCAFPGRYHWSFNGEPTLPNGITEEQARELEATLLARLGFQVVRPDESLEMGNLSGNYQYNGQRMDRAVEAYTSRGFELALQLMNAPDWAIHESYADVENNLWRYPREEDPQRDYVRELLRRYGKHARFVQVFNEPDQVAFWTGTQEEYRTQFEYTADEIHAFDQAKPIVNGGYSLVDLDRTQYFVDALHEHLDLVAYHSHGSLLDLKEDVGTMKSLYQKANLPMPRLVNTEMGYDGWRLDQERRKGQIVPQKTLYCWKSNHAGVLLFGGRMTLGPKRTNQDFGFLDHYFCPRFVFGSVAAMVSTLQGATFHSTLLETDTVFAYQFKRGEETIVAAFTLMEPASLTISTDAEAATFIDPMGNQTSINPTKNLKMELSGYPSYLVLERSSSATASP